MKTTVLGCGILLLVLGGCGTTTPPLSLTCSLTSNGRVVADRVTVRNRTSTPHRSILYGPALGWLAHMHPVLAFRQVMIVNTHGDRSFTGLLLPAATEKSPARVTLRFTRPPRQVALDLTQSSRIRSNNWSAGAYPHCVIGRRP